MPPTLDFGTIHVQRDAAWHRKARHAQEVQHATGRPWISDEPAKITEPGFDYPGGKNDPATTPADMTWHAAVCCLWTAGCTVHTEEGKWGRVPQPGMLQHTVCEAVRDDVWLKIDASWQTGEYNNSENHDSPVDDANEPDGDPIWTYTSLHPDMALSGALRVFSPAGEIGLADHKPVGAFRIARHAASDLRGARHFDGSDASPPRPRKINLESVCAGRRALSRACGGGRPTAMSQFLPARLQLDQVGLERRGVETCAMRVILKRGAVGIGGVQRGAFLDEPLVSRLQDVVLGVELGHCGHARSRWRRSRGLQCSPQMLW